MRKQKKRRGLVGAASRVARGRPSLEEQTRERLAELTGSNSRARISTPGRSMPARVARGRRDFGASVAFAKLAPIM